MGGSGRTGETNMGQAESWSGGASGAPGSFLLLFHPISCLDIREEGTRNLKTRKYHLNIVEMVMSSVALME